MTDKTCGNCQHFHFEAMFDAVILPPQGQVIGEEQYKSAVASGAIPAGIKGIQRCKVSQCRCFPKHETTHTTHFCGQHKAFTHDA